MKAKIISYTTKGLNPTKRSILSKRINGYIDKSNRARYKYKRKGIFADIRHIKIANRSFIVRVEDFLRISKHIKSYGAKVKAWDIDIKKI